MTVVSYAQNGEDVVIARAFPGTHEGFYVDAGASDPVGDSVTKFFYDRGWSGINIDPSAVAFAELTRSRQRDVNLETGLGAAPGTAIFYELQREMMGCSTLSAALAEDYRRDGWECRAREIPITTLARVCEDHAGKRTIDFLKIDVEGHEKDVLAGADFERFRPRLLIVEATRPGTRVPAYADWEDSVLEAEYEFVLFDGLNRFYVRSEDADLAEVLAAPANFFDDYVPYRCSQWQEAAARAEEAETERLALQRRRRDAEAQVVSAVAARQRAEAEVLRARTHAAAAEAASRAAQARETSLELALGRTRTRLTSSQRALRDARTELAAARNALIAAVERDGAT